MIDRWKHLLGLSLNWVPQLVHLYKNPAAEFFLSLSRHAFGGQVEQLVMQNLYLFA